MAVFLTILKVLLWIILIVLGIILLLILLVLFCPIRYRIWGEMYGERIEVNAKVRFLIVSVLVTFTKASGLDYVGKILGIKVYPRGDDEDKPDKKSGKKSKKKEKKKKDDESSEDEQDYEDASDTASDTDDKKDDSEPTSDDTGNVDAALDTDEEEKDNKTPSVTNDSVEESSVENDEKQPSEKEKVSVEDKFSTAIEKAENAMEKAENKIDKILTKIDHVMQFLDKPFTQKTISRVKKLLVTLLKSIKPRKSRADITFGLSNAADTGEMVGKIYAFYPLYYKWLKLTPDFYEKGVEGEFDIRGRIILAVIVFPALRILLSRDFRRTIKLAKKI